MEVAYLDVKRDGADAYEIKAAATYHASFKKGIENIAAIDGMNVLSKRIIYDGNAMPGPNGLSIYNYQEFCTYRNF